MSSLNHTFLFSPSLSPPLSTLSFLPDMVALPPDRLQSLLQAVVQSVQWTYSLFWQLCPRQGNLVWGNGYYNGVIKTRKTVQPMEVTAEEASLHRSEQLRELYESLAAGKAGQPVSRPSAALSPEDLTEAEWFYLMCVSFSFPPGVGLPGEAFTKRQHVWLTRANEADRRVFSRAILAKSARIQTIVCIPLMDGVLELGTTKKVEEDLGLIQHAKSFFTDCLDNQPRPALSGHSTSNSVAYIDQSLFDCQPHAIIQEMSINPHESNQEEEDDGDGDDVDDEAEEEDNDDNDDDGELQGSDSESETGRYDAGVSIQPIHPSLAPAEAIFPANEQSELMQIEMSEDIRFGSSDDCSNRLDSELQMLAMSCNDNNLSDRHQDDSYQDWHLLHEDLCNGFPQSSADTQMKDLSQEDAHFSETVSSILQHNSSRWAHSRSINNLDHSWQTTFSKWNNRDQIHQVLFDGTSQQMLKYILFSVPHLHSKSKDENSTMSRDGDGGSKFQKGTLQEELSANHVLAERRRREKLNERFVILRSLVPFVTKMDKASILGDTIEYVKQLRRRIHDLEARNRQMESNQRSKEIAVRKSSNTKDHSVQINSSSPVLQIATSSRNRNALSEKRKLRIIDGGDKTAKLAKLVEDSSSSVQVSIIETDALLELQCPYRDGLLLKIMQTLHELRLEVISIQSSSANNTFVAELRAKVREVQGKKVKIIEVKEAIYQIFS